MADTPPLDAASTPEVHVLPDGTREWRVGNAYHRLDGPAIEHANGTREWYVNGQYHRLDGPAREFANGHREWLVAGRRHRIDGPAIEYAAGSRAWWVDGRMHRVDGPALVAPDGSREWWVHGQRHRLDGPACEDSTGRREWWAYDKYSAWALPVALWADDMAREAVGWILDPIAQRAAALTLFPTFPTAVQQTAVAEALADTDPELRLWGLRAAARLSDVVRAPEPEVRPRSRARR